MAIAPEPPKEKGKGPRGRKPEKVQISVRIDKAFMDLAYGYARERELHITDIIERGIVYVLQGAKVEMPQTQHLRFLVGELSPAQERLLINCICYFACTELSELELKTRESIEELLAFFAQKDPRGKALAFPFHPSTVVGRGRGTSE